ncbi:hypothetical protein FB45DRAFT_1052476 [Roridomyces roridus]|uniref:Uncharacterized protein n=1 Tax=Roridomyces roridus TaxID=1738132 RepID=A0AAD7CGN6_9AGAR|nr:hypothetical protein FB45DRAFT_1052476 [Roridomyces roridus]
MAASAFSHPTEIPTQMRVASRVKHWEEPFLYRVILVSPYNHIRWIHQPEGFPSRQKTQLLTKIEEGSEPLLRSCVTHLFAKDWDIVSLMRVIDATPRERADGTLDITLPGFRTITHLHLLREGGNHVGAYIHENLLLLPHLTHLAFNILGFQSVLHRQILADRRLKCLVLVAETWDDDDLRVFPPHPAADDDHFVLVRQKDQLRSWFAGETGRRDLWAAVDEFLDARRVGKVDRAQYYFTMDPDEIKSGA